MATEGYVQQSRRSRCGYLSAKWAVLGSLVRCGRRKFLFIGGGKRDRTADLLHAMQALSQLSYTPNRQGKIVSVDQGGVKETPVRCASRPALNRGNLGVPL